MTQSIAPADPRAPWSAGSRDTPSAGAVSQTRARLIRRLASRRTRRREGLALAEGPRVVQEALASELRVKWVLAGAGWVAATDAGRRIASLCGDRGAPLQLADDDKVADMATTQRPPPVLACVEAPQPEPRPLTRGRFLMPVGVQIPGNLGALVRSAWAFGVDGVVVGPGVVDPWNPKAVRASAGGVFRVPLVAAPSGGWGPASKVAGAAPEAASGPAAAPTGSVGRERDPWAGVNLLCADPRGAPVRAARGGQAAGSAHAVKGVRAAKARQETTGTSGRDWVLAVGGEVGGLPAQLRRRAHALAVPMAGGAESLNVAVAGSILMHLLTARS